MRLVQVVDDGLGELKGQILEVTHYMDYFDYINIIKVPPPPPQGDTTTSNRYDEEL